MTDAIAISGWYVISQDNGGGWLAVKIDNGGQCVDFVCQAGAAESIAAKDPNAWVCQAILDGQVDPQITLENANAVAEAADVDPASCVVEWVVE